jgi:enoyl-CoA hydratase/carnithine racemase
LAGAKRLLHSSLESSLEQHLELEAQLIAEASGSPEGIEGIASFVAKRPPSFPHG